MGWWNKMCLSTKKKDWKVVADAECKFTIGGLWIADYQITGTLVFYQDANNSSNRKTEIIGIQKRWKRDAMEMMEPKIYLWRDHDGPLPYFAEER